MPLKTKTFLSNICLYTFLILGGGCTDEAGMENIGKYRSPHPSYHQCNGESLHRH